MKIEDTLVMGSEPSPNLTIECVEQTIHNIKAEPGLAELFAIVENKVWWIKV